MRRPCRTPWPAAVALAGVVVSAGCGVRPTGIISAGGPPRAVGKAATITVYLLHSSGSLVPVTRPGVPGHPYLAIQQLALRPTTAERARGLRTEVHQPLEARTAGDTFGMLIVDLSSEAPHRRVSWSRLALAQIACTAGAVPGVVSVRLRSAPGADGILTCGEYGHLLK